MDIRTTRFVCLSLMFFIICFLFTPFSQCVAGSMTEPDLKSSMIINPDKQFNFAEHCFSGKDYLTAVLEYKRFIYFFPEDHRVETAMYRIGMSYYLGEHFKEAIDSFNAVIDKYVDTDLSVKSYFMISDAYVKQYAFGPAVINLNNLITMTYDEEVRDEACYKTGWIYIETASWEEARRYFSKISTTNKNKYRLEQLTDELNKEKSIPGKNPSLSGFLSIIPGAGYFYCERYQDALIAFLLNGGLILAAVESFDDNNTALGGVISFVEFGFYAGNIYGAVTSAHKYNRKQTARFIETLKNNTKINLSADVKNKGICLAFEFIF
jgi:TolA-binding protein